ncbi:MAG: hypothetical protein LBD35_00960 [Prevotellaceae bacterium]|jgi:hypothetical protein|nr:hypothetical protein [Prevotellaceae bacterium]
MDGKNFVFATAVFFAVSCSNELDENLNGKEIEIAKERKYLKFDTQEELTVLLNEYIAAEKAPNVKSVSNRNISNGFVSIAKWREEQTPSTESGFGKSDDVMEEMTQEEFNVMNAKFLLRDPVLWNIFDTTLRISVGNNFYKITRHGTFITPVGNEEELYDVIRNFDVFGAAYHNGQWKGVRFYKK